LRGGWTAIGAFLSGFGSFARWGFGSTLGGAGSAFFFGH
jgi:hypothetical protein